jgi:hypothetical protein
MKLEKWTGSFLGKNKKNEQKKQENYFHQRIT